MSRREGMSKKNFLTGSLAFLGITLFILSGCPNVVDDGTTPIEEASDIPVEITVEKGAATLGIVLSTGSFQESLNEAYFVVEPGTTGLNLGTKKKITRISAQQVAIKQDSDGKPAEEGGTIKVTIKKAAFAATSNAVGDKVAQGSIAAKDSAADVSAGNNAIKVTLTKGLFDSGITGSDFLHGSGSAITTTDASAVTVSSDKKTAIIYGTTATTTNKAKIGISASALLGYPIVSPSEVEIAGITDADIIVQSSKQAQGDNYIIVTLKNSKVFDPDTSSYFSINSGTGTPAPANNISIGGGETKFSSNTKAVIKVDTASSSTSSFELKIPRAVFTLPATVLASDITVETTKQATTLTITPIAVTGSPNQLVVTISGGGKFKSDLSDATKFSNTSGTSSDITASSIALSINDTVATITLSGTPNGTWGLTLIAEDVLADDSWLVEPDDITLSWGPSS